MKRILCPLFAMIIALSIALPVSVFADSNTAPLCSEHVNKSCCAKIDSSCCGSTENVVQNKLIHGRAGQAELVRIPSSVSHTHNCAQLEHPAEN